MTIKLGHCRWTMPEEQIRLNYFVVGILLLPIYIRLMGVLGQICILTDAMHEVLAYEQKASLLVNVRDPDEAFTSYSFPSKTIEYMLSGTPLLTTRLPGIPKEYDKYLILIEDNLPQTIASGIETAFRMTSEARQSLGNAAACFIAEEKNSDKQAEKILRFISERL